MVPICGDLQQGFPLKAGPGVGDRPRNTRDWKRLPPITMAGSQKYVPKPVPPAGLGMRWNETSNMTREEIQSKILIVFKEEFEITNPGLDENLTEKYDFDSIDALELLGEIETLLGSELTREEKKASMDIRTINQICDYIELLAKKRSL